MTFLQIPSLLLQRTGRGTNGAICQGRCVCCSGHPVLEQVSDCSSLKPLLTPLAWPEHSVPRAQLRASLFPQYSMMAAGQSLCVLPRAPALSHSSCVPSAWHRTWLSLRALLETVEWMVGSAPGALCLDRPPRGPFPGGSPPPRPCGKQAA